MNTHLLCRIALGAILVGSVQAKPLEIWISSFQDKVYYEDMVRQYQSRVDKEFAANIQAFGFREMPDKLAVSIKTGANPPDIVQLDEVLFGSYLAGQAPFVDLTERVKESGLNKDIVPARLSLFSKDGHLYGLPQSLSAMVLYYRTDLFEKLDLKPADIDTWEKFVLEGKRLAQNKQAMIGLDPSYFEILLRQRGSDWFGADGKSFPNRKLAVETMQWLSDLQKDGIGVQPERGSIFDPLFFSSAVASGQVLCVIGADWYGLDMIQQFTPELKGKWGVMPLPAWKTESGALSRRTSTFAGQGLMIYKDSQEIEAAWKFIRFVMTDLEANVQRFTQGNSFPAYQPAWKDPRLLKDIEFFNNQPLGRILADLAPEVPEVAMTARRPQAVFLFQERFFSSLMYGQNSAEETVSALQAILDKP